MSAKESSQISYLLDEFSSSSPLYPLDICEVNFGSAASISGLVFTYIIVLLQMKVGDSTAGGETTTSTAAIPQNVTQICNCTNATAN